VTDFFFFLQILGMWNLSFRESEFHLFFFAKIGNVVMFLSQVEHVVREEKTVAAYELIGIYCELLVVRLGVIESQK